ncbi:hypothetical protein SCA6_016657 [Theobroma cacao]
MGRRLGVGRSPSSSSSVLNQKILSRRLLSCQQYAGSTVDEIVELLQTNYPDYRRIKKQPLTRVVKQALQALQSSSKNSQKASLSVSDFNFDDDGHNERAIAPFSSSPPPTCSRKKPRRMDETEERLQRMEDLHIQRRQMQHNSNSELDSESSSSSSSSSSEEEEDGAVSTSEDAIYGQKDEPKFDLMKSMLRQGYTQSNSSKSNLEEKNIEMEIATNKPKSKIDMTNANKESAELKKETKVSVSVGAAADGVEVKGIEGPRFRDLGGMGGVLEELKMEVIVPLYHPHLPRWLGVRPMAGILLHGPPGCGKTKLAHAIANETGVPFYKISATEVVSGVSGIRLLHEILSVLTLNLRLEGSFDLWKIARATPGFVGADLAALANKAGNLAMKRIIDQRKHEFSRESIDEEQADEWWRQPWLPEEMEKLTITMADFEEAAKMVQPSSRREGFSTIPNVKWEDVGGLDFLRQEFDRYIVRRIKFPEDYAEFGVDLETGFLLYGPPGCGKTLIAKAVANEAGANFIHIKGPELLNKYVGESELAVRTLFSRARTCSPCILFFDEVDALTTKRGKEGGWVVERLLNQLLIELDGSDQRRGVYVIGATNRPEVMDRAVLRPGRFGKLLYVSLPNPDERGLILKALARKKPIDASVDLSAIGRMEACDNLSGADLSALMNEAAMAALEEKLTSTGISDTSWTIKTFHFERALSKISPSVSNKQKQFYQVLSESFKAA